MLASILAQPDRSFFSCSDFDPCDPSSAIADPLTTSDSSSLLTHIDQIDALLLFVNRHSLQPHLPSLPLRRRTPIHPSTPSVRRHLHDGLSVTRHHGRSFPGTISIKCWTMRDLLVVQKISLIEITSTAVLLAIVVVVVVDLSRVFHAVDSATLQLVHRCTPAPDGMLAVPAVLPTPSPLDTSLTNSCCDGLASSPIFG